MSELRDFLAGFGDVDEQVSLRSLTTFKVGGTADYVCYPRNNFSLQSIIDYCRENGISYKVFGNGSNLLCSDDVYHGVVIKLTRMMHEVYYDADDEIVVQAGASVIALAYDCARKGLSGLEFAAGIPGTLGGCLYMNAGAYKSSLADIVREVQVLKCDEVVWMKNEECCFGYRSSIFQKHPDWVILAARIALKKGETEQISELMKNRQKRRFETQPLDYPSAGSVFRNPEGGFAWQLIDGIGYRGHAIGDAKVSEKHSNFIVNAGEARADDVRQLINEIIEKVREKYDQEMILEVEKFNWKK